MVTITMTAVYVTEAYSYLYGNDLQEQQIIWEIFNYIIHFTNCCHYIHA